MTRETKQLIRRIGITAIEIILMAAAVLLLIVVGQSLGISEAQAERYEDLTTGYILCDDYVNIRMFPNNDHEPLGRFETGDMVILDGRKKNGYLHIVDLSLEACEGWVHSGFVVYDRPIKVNETAVITCKGRLAARKNVGGKRMRWLKSGASIKVYWWSDEWCITNCGYVKTQFIELAGD